MVSASAQVQLTVKTGEGLSTHSQKAVSANQVLRGVHQILTFEKVCFIQDM